MAMTGNAIREALEPFAKVAEHDIGADEADTDFFQPMVRYNSAPRLTVGDLRRARAAYDAIGAGVKALEKCHHCGGSGFDPVDGVSPCSWCRGSGADPDQHSTHTDAGAGPVGEAVAASIAAMVDGWYRHHPAAPNVPAIPADMIQRRLARFAAHSADEPGEVERNEARIETLRVELIRTDADWKAAEAALAESEQNAQGLASDLAGTQAELAEMRECLEKVEAAARAALAFRRGPSITQSGLRDNDDSRAALGELEAALTGPAQEAGR